MFLKNGDYTEKYNKNFSFGEMSCYIVKSTIFIEWPFI